MPETAPVFGPLPLRIDSTCCEYELPVLIGIVVQDVVIVGEQLRVRAGGCNGRLDLVI